MSVATKIDKQVRKFNEKVRMFNKIIKQKSVTSTKSSKKKSAPSSKYPKIASWPGILVSHKEARTKVFLARRLGKQGHSPSPVFISKCL